MSEIKEVKKYEVESGEVFDTKEEAEQHLDALEVCHVLSNQIQRFGQLDANNIFQASLALVASNSVFVRRVPPSQEAEG